MDGGWKNILFFGSVCMLLLFPLQPASSTFGFILIKGEYDWLGALSYCRAHYQDLAIISAEKNVTRINSLMASYPTRPAWIGLRDDVDGWKWSLSGVGVNASAGEQFWGWQKGQPDNNGSDQRCVSMTADGLWRDNSCTLVNLPFVCIIEDNKNLHAQNPYVLEFEGLSWVDAQKFCRLHCTDLASVRNLSESQDIQQMMQEPPVVPEVWIGLHRDSWMWPNGTNSSISRWSDGQPDNAVDPEACVSLLNGTWNDTSCSAKMYFICQGTFTTTDPQPGGIPAGNVVQRRTTVVKMELMSNSDLEDPAVGDDLLQQIAAALESKGVTDVTLTWRTLKKEPQPTERDTFGRKIN